MDVSQPLTTIHLRKVIGITESKVCYAKSTIRDKKMHRL